MLSELSLPNESTERAIVNLGALSEVCGETAVLRSQYQATFERFRKSLNSCAISPAFSSHSSRGLSGSS